MIKLLKEKHTNKYGKSAIQCYALIKIKITTDIIVIRIFLFFTAKWISIPQNIAFTNKVSNSLLNLIAAAAPNNGIKLGLAIAYNPTVAAIPIKLKINIYSIWEALFLFKKPIFPVNKYNYMFIIVTNPKLNKIAPNIFGAINNNIISPKPINIPAKIDFFPIYIFISKIFPLM